jgi:hypothetical protein
MRKRLHMDDDQGTILGGIQGETDMDRVQNRRKVLVDADRLLGENGVGGHCLLSLLPQLSPASIETLLQFVLTGFCEDPEYAQACDFVEELHRGDYDEMAEWIAQSIKSDANMHSEADLAVYLKDLIGRDLKEIDGR